LIGRAVLAFFLSLVPLGAAGWLTARVRKSRPISWWTNAALAFGGAVAALATFYVERAVFRFMDISVEATPSTGTAALLGLVLFASPLEEAAKVLVVWPTVWTRRLVGPGLGVVFAVSAASGFAAAETALIVMSSPARLAAIRAAAGIPAHAFCAGLWGYALGVRTRSSGSRWFAPAWLLAVGVHALYDHIVFGRGPGMLGIAFPMLMAMAWVGWSALRDIAPSGHDGPSSLPLHLPEPPSLGEVQRALRRTDEPLVLRWIVLGALVNIGAAIVCVGAAVVVARRFGIDLSLADESDMRSNGPLVVLGGALLAAFPLAGYLVARASGAHTVLEPAFAAGLAMALTVAILSVTAPSAVIFAFAILPVAFALACGGAWFGMDS
jgi:hypothetical protein